MMRAATRMSLLFVLATVGCGGRGNVDLLESRLREQEDRLSTVKSQLDEARSELTIARKESRALRNQLADRGKPALLPERADALFRANGVQFNQLFTGGLDRDGHAGDELLIATLVPHDAQGEMVKLPGRIQLEAFDLAQSGEKRTIGRWEFDTDQAIQHWHRGYLASGYMFRLPWQQVPKHSRLLLHARLTVSDGRQFDTTREVTITPPTETLAQNQTPPRLPPVDDSRSRRSAETRPRLPNQSVTQAGSQSSAAMPFLLNPSDGGDSKQAPAFPENADHPPADNPFFDEPSADSKKPSGTQPSPALTLKPADPPQLLPTRIRPVPLPPARGDAKPGTDNSRSKNRRPYNRRPHPVTPNKPDSGPRLFRRSAPPLRTSDNFTEQTQPAYH